MRDAVEELREQMQGHLFETFVTDYWLHVGSGERCCRGIARADTASSLPDSLRFDSPEQSAAG